MVPPWMSKGPAHGAGPFENSELQSLQSVAGLGVGDPRRGTAPVLHTGRNDGEGAVGVLGGIDLNRLVRGVPLQVVVGARRPRLEQSAVVRGDTVSKDRVLKTGRDRVDVRGGVDENYGAGTRRVRTRLRVDRLGRQLEGLDVGLAGARNGALT